MKKYIKRKAGKRNNININMPNHKGISTISSITYNKSGYVEENRCPACDGEGVDFVDFTNSRGGSVNFRICELCDGNGVAIEDKDYKVVMFYDNDNKLVTDFEKINKIGE